MVKKVEEIRSDKGVTVLKIGETFVKIKAIDIDEDEIVDSERITKIDINNLVAEILTIPVLLNRWGNFLAEMESNLKLTKLDYEIFCAQKREDIRKNFIEDGDKKPTIQKVEDALILDSAHKVFKKKVIRAERDKEVTSSIYWAVKDKADKLEKLSLTISRDDIDSLESTTINNMRVVVKR